MQKYWVCVLIILFQQKSYCQNILPNGSFEDENICTEFNEKCSPAGWINISLNIPLLINCYAMDGKSFDGRLFIKVIAGNNKIPDIRTFISTRLLCGLRKGNKYLVQFYFRTSSPATDSIGIYFSSTDFLYEKRSFKEIKPAAWINGFAKGEDNTEWTKRSCIYTASGEEVFFSAGVFKRVDPILNDSNNAEAECYLYLDNISLIPADRNERLPFSADSIKNILYNDHDRHGKLIKNRYAFSDHPPLINHPPQTLMLALDTLIMPDLIFESGKAVLNKESYKFLDNLVTKIQNCLIDSIVIEGHTDSIGSNMRNRKLSMDRALLVSNYIRKKLIFLPDDKFIIRSYAYMKPVAANLTLAGRQKNRRVEIYVFSIK